MQTPEEDAAINAGFVADADSCELGADEFKQLRRDWPLDSGTKTQVTLRLNVETLEKFMSSGDGWQTRQ